MPQLQPTYNITVTQDNYGFTIITKVQSSPVNTHVVGYTPAGVIFYQSATTNNVSANVVVSKAGLTTSGQYCFFIYDDNDNDMADVCIPVTIAGAPVYTPPATTTPPASTTGTAPAATPPATTKPPATNPSTTPAIITTIAAKLGMSTTTIEYAIVLIVLMYLMQ
jgi:hypothetical protein